MQDDIATPETNSEPNSTPTEASGVVIGEPTAYRQPEPVQPAPADSEPTTPTPGPAPKKKSKNKKLLVLLLVLLLAVGGGAAYWFLIREDKAPAVANKELQEIEVLRVGSAQGPASVYFPDEGVLGIQVSMDHQIYEGLVGFDKNTIVPRIAESWTNPDEKTWVFKIRSGVKFHTGNEVKAKEVKAALDDLKKYDYWSLFVSTIDTVEATGDLELTVKTKEPDSLLLNRLAQAYISDLSAPEKLGNNGTGPYQEDDTATNDANNTTLVAFDEYHSGRAKTRKVVVKIYATDDEIVKAYKAKEIDIAETIPIPSVEKELEGIDHATLDIQAPGVFGLYMNQLRTDSTTLKNKDVRQAVAQAMDRQTLIDEVGNKNSPSTQVIPKSLPGYDSSISFPAFDLVAAKASLTKAGYNNEPLDFVYIEELQQDAPILIKQLKAAGFNVREKSYTGDETDTAVEEVAAGRFDFFGASYSSDVADARDILGGLLSSTESAYPSYNDATYDKLLTDSDKEFDPVKRIELLQKANKHILDNLAWIPLRNSVYAAYHPKDIAVDSDFNSGGLSAYYFKVGRIVQ